MFTDAHLAEGEESPTLGPAYFCSRDVVERAMAGVQASDFKPLIDSFSKEFTDAVWRTVQDHLLSDTEMNLQGAMWRQVDDMVKHLLAGEKWAMDRFVLGARYDCERIREAVAAHIPNVLRDARIADLEAQLERMKNDLAFYQNR